MPSSLRGTRSGMRSAGRRVLTEAARSYLRGRTRMINLSVPYRRSVSYRTRYPKRRSKKTMRRHKMYRRTVPSAGLRSRQVSTNTTGTAVNAVPTGGRCRLLDQVDDNNVNCQMGAIYMKPVPNPATISAVSNTRARTSNHVNYHGIKINRTFALPYSEIIFNTSVVVNWAIIQFRRNGFENCQNAGGVPENLYTAFFRHTPKNSTVNDDEDFDDYTAASQVWSHEMNCLAMNPDNNYKIITHRRFILSDKSSSQGIGNGGPGPQKVQWNQCWMKNINFYYKMGKTLSFTENSSARPENPICEIWWYNSVVEDGKPADVTITSTYGMNTFNKNTTYFSDTN